MTTEPSAADQSESGTESGMVDWDLAVRLGARLATDGPTVSPAEAADAVAELRAGANRSTGLVRDFTGLNAPEDVAPVLVVDRAGWIQANADGFRTVLEPIAARLSARKSPGPIGRSIGSKVTGTEVGAVLGYLSGKVLGQFDPFYEPAGRLLLVAPNIVQIERELKVDPHDFRLWVCLHEETHRVQFTAVPWMRGHLFDQISLVAESMESSVLEDGLQRLGRAVREGGKGNLLELLGSPEQKEVLDRVTGMMSLLEGHAEVVMDDVGPGVIPSVGAIRRAFNRRRQGAGTVDKVIRRLLGMESKMAQYRDGATFVRAVVDRVGMDQFNAVWAAPENLPSKAEIAAPERWVERVL